jgi:uncharacterized membrane protein
MSDRVNVWTGWTMRICAVIGAAIILSGLILDNEQVIVIGLIAVVAAPLLGLAVTLLALCVQREYVWAAIALVLIGLFSVELIDWRYSAVILAVSVILLAIAYLSYKRHTDG